MLKLFKDYFTQNPYITAVQKSSLVSGSTIFALELLGYNIQTLSVMIGTLGGYLASKKDLDEADLRLFNGLEVPLATACTSALVNEILKAMTGLPGYQTIIGTTVAIQLACLVAQHISAPQVIGPMRPGGF